MRIVIADDEMLLREGLARLLADEEAKLKELSPSKTTEDKKAF